MTDRHFQVSQLICFLHNLTCKPLSARNLFPVQSTWLSKNDVFSIPSLLFIPFQFAWDQCIGYCLRLYMYIKAKGCAHYGSIVCATISRVPRQDPRFPVAASIYVMSLNKVSKGHTDYRQEGKNGELGFFVCLCTWIGFVGVTNLPTPPMVSPCNV